MKCDIKKLMSLILCMFTLYVCSTPKAAIASPSSLKQFEGTYIYKDSISSFVIVLEYIDENKMYVEAFGAQYNRFSGSWHFIFNYDSNSKKLVYQDTASSEELIVYLIGNDTIEIDDTAHFIKYSSQYYGANFFGFEGPQYKKVE